LVVLQLAVAAAAVYFVLQSVNLGDTRRSFAHANYWLLPAAVGFLLLDLALRAVRWRLLLLPRTGVSVPNLFGAANVGYLFNTLLPLRAGEVARTLVIDELEDTGKVAAAASIAVERGIDLVAMVVLALLLFPFIDEPSWARGPALVLGAVVVAGFVVLAVLARLQEAGHEFWRPLVRRIPKAGTKLDDLAAVVLSGMHPLLRPRVLAQVVGLTALLWVFATLSFFMMLRTFNVDGGFGAAALVLSATTLGMIVPSSPGYVGVFEAICVTTLASVFGVPHEEALSYAAAQHALIIVVPSALGIAFLVAHGDLFEQILASLRRREPRDRTSAAAGVRETTAAGTGADL
jgi:uncharacterized protein (TIRG00374 family)